MNAVRALEILRAALPTATLAEVHFVAAVTGFESQWGDGWNQKGDPLGIGSNNWGAVQFFPTVDANESNSFFHLDHHADGTPYGALFRKYSTPEAGAADAARKILKPNVRAALAEGDGTAAVQAMHSNHYFEASPDLYASRVGAKYREILTATGERRLLDFGDSNPEEPGVLRSSATGFGLFMGIVTVCGIGALVSSVVQKTRVT